MLSFRKHFTTLKDLTLSPFGRHIRNFGPEYPWKGINNNIRKVTNIKFEAECNLKEIMENTNKWSLDRHFCLDVLAHKGSNNRTTLVQQAGELERRLEAYNRKELESNPDSVIFVRWLTSLRDIIVKNDVRSLGNGFNTMMYHIGFLNGYTYNA